jgi:predicted GIY-YIG superfamily endonuclease
MPVDLAEQTTPEELHILYRFFDAGGDLLYVGMTNNPPRRFTEHKTVKSWWFIVATITLEQIDSRTALKCAERAAIRDENPRYNDIAAMLPVSRSVGEQPASVAETAATELRLARTEVREAMCEAERAALVAINDGMTEVDAAKQLGVNRMTVRRWLGKL